MYSCFKIHEGKAVYICRKSILISFLFQVCPSMASLLPTTALCSCRVLVRVMLLLCSAQLTGLPAVQVLLAELESGSTLIEGWFPLWLLRRGILSRTIETEALHWFVSTEGPTWVCLQVTLEPTAAKYLTKTMWCRHCVWEHISQRVQVSDYFQFLDRCRYTACVIMICLLLVSRHTLQVCQQCILRGGG